MNILALDQLGKCFRRALETKPRIVQTHDRKNLSADFETEIVAPLHVLGGLGKCQAKLANCVDIHLFNPESDRLDRKSNFTRRFKCKPALLEIPIYKSLAWATAPGLSAVRAGSSPGDRRTTTTPSPPFTVPSNSASTGSTPLLFTAWDTPKKSSPVRSKAGSARGLMCSLSAPYAGMPKARCRKY